MYSYNGPPKLFKWNILKTLSYSSYCGAILGWVDFIICT